MSLRSEQRTLSTSSRSSVNTGFEELVAKDAICSTLDLKKAIEEEAEKKLDGASGRER